MTDLMKVVMVPMFENEEDKRRCHCASTQAEASHFPSLLSFPGPCIYSHHKSDDVEGGSDVEQLEYKVPRHVRRLGPEQIKVSGAEYCGVQHLRDEGDT